MDLDVGHVAALVTHQNVERLQRHDELQVDDVAVCRGEQAGWQETQQQVKEGGEGSARSSVFLFYSLDPQDDVWSSAFLFSVGQEDSAADRKSMAESSASVWSMRSRVLKVTWTRGTLM